MPFIVPRHGIYLHVLDFLVVACHCEVCDQLHQDELPLESCRYYKYFCMSINYSLNGQDPQERAQAEQILRVFGQTTEYIAHCKVGRTPNFLPEQCLHALKEPTQTLSTF